MNKSKYPRKKLTQKEIKEALRRQEAFREFYEKNRKEELGSMYNLMLILDYAKKHPDPMKRVPNEPQYFVTSKGKVYL